MNGRFVAQGRISMKNNKLRCQALELKGVFGSVYSHSGQNVAFSIKHQRQRWVLFCFALRKVETAGV